MVVFGAVSELGQPEACKGFGGTRPVRNNPVCVHRAPLGQTGEMIRGI